MFLLFTNIILQTTPPPPGAPPGFFLPYIGIAVLAGLVYGVLRINKNKNKNL